MLRTVLLTSALIASLFAQTIIKEEFNNLEGWTHKSFPNIERKSLYEVSEGILKTTSNDSASFIVFEKEFEVEKFPIVSWKWKIEKVYKNGDAKTKDGDDYPVRIYVMFKYDPDNASFLDSITYGYAKSAYGEYPPHSSLNYIWANKHYDESIIENAYTSKAQMILLQMGDAKANTWVTESINILQDYKKAFGENPPKIARIAIMADSDNTHDSSSAYLDYIEVRSK